MSGRHVNVLLLLWLMSFAELVGRSDACGGWLNTLFLCFIIMIIITILIIIIIYIIVVWKAREDVVYKH